MVGAIAFFMLGLAGLALGAELLVRGAATVAARLDISPLVVGLTIVAFGTSSPELAVSLKSGLGGQPDIAVGNVVGSCIFNLLGILGIVGLVSPHALQVSDAAVAFDIPVMIAVAVACLPICFTGFVIERWEGGLFLALYVAYVTKKKGTWCLFLRRPAGRGRGRRGPVTRRTRRTCTARSATGS